MEFKELYKRPHGTYTKDKDGIIVRSKGLANNSIDECVRQHVRSFMSPSPRPGTGSQYSDDFETESSNGEDDITAADRLLQELDDILGDTNVDKNLNRDIGKGVGKYVDNGIGKNAYADVDKGAYRDVGKGLKIEVDKRVDREVHKETKVLAREPTEVKNQVQLPTTKWNAQQPPVAVNDDFGREIKIQLPAAPEGLMAIKLPPLFPFNKQMDIAIQTLEDEVEQAVADLEITESSSRDSQRTKRRNGLRRFMCGMCGVTDDEREEVDSDEKKSSNNCFKRMWKQLRKLF